MHPTVTRHTRLAGALFALGLAACTQSPPFDEKGTGNGDDTPDMPSTGSPELPDGEVTEPLPPEVTGTLDIPEAPYDYAPALPEHFRVPAVTGLDNTPANNPVSNDGATLGRVLFYDKALSQNRTVACASCHFAGAAFGDESALSTGFDGGATGRNSMQLVNVRYYANGHMFWDERADTLEIQVLMPIQDTVEMGLSLEELVERVEGEAYYPPLFERAFGSDEIDADRISRALAQFVRSLVSAESRYDQGLAAAGDIRDPFPNFTNEEELGKQLFLGRARCATCHLDNPPGGAPSNGPPPLANQAIFQLRGPANNGLDAGPIEDDNGIGDRTGDPAEDGVFKVSSLRNVALSAPYMHDGRFESLAEVVAFYDQDVQAHPNLDPRLRGPDGQPRRLGLDVGERAALVAFLGTLTDMTMLAEPRFQNPFIDEL